jgi:hypothetical protein
VLVSGCSKKQAPQAAALPQVGVITVHTQPVARITDLRSRTSTVLISEIRPQVSGVILTRLFVEGNDVKAGRVWKRRSPDAARLGASLQSSWPGRATEPNTTWPEAPRQVPELIRAMGFDRKYTLPYGSRRGKIDRRRAVHLVA